MGAIAKKGRAQQALGPPFLRGCEMATFDTQATESTAQVGSSVLAAAPHVVQLSSFSCLSAKTRRALAVDPEDFLPRPPASWPSDGSTANLVIFLAKVLIHEPVRTTTQVHVY